MSGLLHFTVTEQELVRVDTFDGAADSKNYLRLHVDFKTKPWSPEYTKAVFANAYGFVYEVQLDENGECAFPEDITKSSGLVQISLCYEGTIERQHHDPSTGEDAPMTYGQRITTNSVEFYLHDSEIREETN